MKIVVDADACPKGVLKICFDLGREFNVPVWTVASINHRIESDHHITVDSGSQEADLKIINITDKGDIVVTQDWGLAAMVLGKPAISLNPSGREYRPETMVFLMEEREAKAKHRRGGGRTKGPQKRKNQDDSNFSFGLRKALVSSNR